MRRPIYLPRRDAVEASFVVYHPDGGPACCVWMVPGSHVEIVGPRYVSAALADAEPWSQDRQYQFDKERRRAQR